MEETCGISWLPDLVLLDIFDAVPTLRECVQLELVCTQWRRVGLWYWRRLNVLRSSHIGCADIHRVNRGVRPASAILARTECSRIRVVELSNVYFHLSFLRSIVEAAGNTLCKVVVNCNLAATSQLHSFNRDYFSFLNSVPHLQQLVVAVRDLIVLSDGRCLAEMQPQYVDYQLPFPPCTQLLTYCYRSHSLPLWNAQSNLALLDMIQNASKLHTLCLSIMPAIYPFRFWWPLDRIHFNCCLSTLILEFCDDWPSSDAFVKALIYSFPSLQNLFLAFVVGLSLESMQIVAECRQLRTMRHLALRFCSVIALEGIKRVLHARNAAAMSTLRLSCRFSPDEFDADELKKANVELDWDVDAAIDALVFG